MKKLIVLFFLFVSMNFVLASQEEFDWDFDTLFDEPIAEEGEESEAGEEFETPKADENAPINLRDKITLEAAYGFFVALSPGWTEAPWYSRYGKEYTNVLGARMDALLSMVIPLSNTIRVKNAFYFSLPDDSVFSIKEFYFEYNMIDMVFVQAGLFEITWGISRFFPFTNLPALVPSDVKKPGSAFIARSTIPIGIGGLELLAMTRTGYIKDLSSPSIDEMAYGMKYNLAFQAADIDTGFLYHKKMPMRYFISIKTTIVNTELYTEGLASYDHEDTKDIQFSGNIGIIQDFFGGKLTASGEVFYNGETYSAWWRQKTDILEGSKVELIKGLNGALMLVFRPGVIGMRIFSQGLYNHEQKSAWLVPGISIKPGDITMSVSVPMALGTRRDIGDASNYYRNNIDKENRPFSIVFAIRYTGKSRYTF